MTEGNFDELLSLLRERITKQDTIMRSAVAPGLKLAIIICYLAIGSIFTDLQYQFRVHKITISKFIPEVCEVLYEALKDKYMKVGKYISLLK